MTVGPFARLAVIVALVAIAAVVVVTILPRDDGDPFADGDAIDAPRDDPEDREQGDDEAIA